MTQKSNFRQDLDCAVHCTKLNHPCLGFTSNSCNIIDNFSSFVIATFAKPENRIFIPADSKNSIVTTPHFLIINAAGTDLIDLSLDIHVSPPVSYPLTQSWPGFFSPCAVYMQTQKKVVFRSLQEPQNLYQWYLGDDKVTKMTSVVDDSRSSAICATSSRFETLVVYSGMIIASAYIYKNGQNEVVPASRKAWNACGAMHPLDEDVLFIFGGTQVYNDEKKAFSYRISDGLTTMLADISSGEGFGLSCADFVKGNGEPAIILLGGQGSTLVKEYDIWTDSYIERQNIGNDVNLDVVLAFHGFIYHFERSTRVWKMDVDFKQANWELTNGSAFPLDLDILSDQFAIVPYF